MMTNTRKQLLVISLVSLGAIAILSTLVPTASQAVASAQLAVLDFFTVHKQGLRLGARAASKDIAIVYFDYQSAVELGQVRTYESDLAVYRSLFQSGAKIIYDCRIVAAADDTTYAEIQPLLEGMRSIQSNGTLMRDISLSPTLYEQHGEPYSSLLVQNIINTHPHRFPNIAARLYPLAYFDARGALESAPLCICRTFRDEPRWTTGQVSEQLRECGIFDIWHTLYPQLVPQFDKPVSNYAFGETELKWHGFATSNSLVAPAAFWVSYDPPSDGYAEFSFADYLKNTNTPDLSGKIVIIGFEPSIDPTSDTYAIPNNQEKASAAKVLAFATQTLLDSCSMREVSRGWQLLIGSILIVTVGLAAGLMRPQYAIGVTLLLLVSYWFITVSLYRNQLLADFLITPVLAITAGVISAAFTAWSGLRARQRIIDLFGRYVPRAVVNQLIQQPELQQLAVGGSSREVTVMFADIRGFTSFSENLSPENVVDELNSLLHVMVECTFEHAGTLDKFIGDAILVLFNAPLLQADHCKRALMTAIDIQRRLKSHPSGLRIGIGIHRGQAVVGNIGTPQRMEYTAIGSTVNVASRLCDLAAPGEIVVSKEVMSLIDKEFEINKVETAIVKGISGSIEIGRISQVGDKELT